MKLMNIQKVCILSKKAFLIIFGVVLDPEPTKVGVKIELSVFELKNVGDPQ